jgi:predicted TIM-barrel fold metal-dependent hydrolase
MLDCVRAYNDFLVEWAAADPTRLIPTMCLPFWDIDAALRELQRCHDLGHRGVLLAAHYEKAGFANISDPVWEPVLAAAQERELSINFHIGFSQLSNADIEQMWGTRTRAAMETTAPDVLASVRAQTVGFLGNAQAIVDIIVNGVCHRFPRLRFVSVESGFGYVPFVLQALDWQWANDGGHRVCPERDRLPSDYFRRQIYATFWYERPAVEHLEQFQDNLMFETDFPHPTSLTPGPWSAARPARATVLDSLRGVDLGVARKLLHDNAATVYGLS